MKDSRDECDADGKAKCGVNRFRTAQVKKGPIPGNRGIHGAVKGAAGDHGDQCGDIENGCGGFQKTGQNFGVDLADGSRREIGKEKVCVEAIVKDQIDSAA